MSDGVRTSEAGGPVLSRRAAAGCWAAIIGVDLASLYFFESRHLSNLYGDGMAHVEGARRIFDSLSPGYGAIGAAWLPLFHLLAAPLAINNTLWRTGLAGSLVSAAAFALAAWFVFRFSFEANRSLAAGVLSLACFLLSLNLLYAATAPLTELLAIFWAVLVVYSLFRFQQSGKTATVVGAGVAAFFGTLTRYDGWYLLSFAALFIVFCRPRPWLDRAGQALLFCLVASCGPLLWLLHNAHRFHNALDFYNGSYSAKAIYAHQLATTGFPYPTAGRLWLSAHYYLEDIKLVVGPWSLALACLGFVVWIWHRDFRRRRSAAILLLVPLPFYIQALAYASVPLYVPTLFPYAYYNLRYGLEMAPAVAVFAGFLLPGRHTGRRRRVLLAVLCAILAGQAMAMGRLGARNLLVVREGILNTPCKSQAERDVIRFLRGHYDGHRVLLAAGKWPCVMPQLAIHYRKTLTEADRKYWRLLPQGAAPYAGWIIRQRGDAVDDLMRAYPGAFAGFERVDNAALAHGSYLEIYRRRPGTPQAQTLQHRKQSR